MSGFTLIEMLVFIFIFSVVSLAFYRTLATGIQVALDSKNRLGALALANEKMEIARNLKYEDVGTVGGIPEGILPETESVSANGTGYVVETFIQYVDDELDGQSPADAIADDYKRVKITVSWGSPTSPSKEVSLVSRFVPPGLEVASGDGVLSIHIINSAGEGVPQASLHIVNNNVSPAVNITSSTGLDGNLILPGAEQSIQNYAITVSKAGYETVGTVSPGNVAYSPVDVHASVMTGLLNVKSIVIDLVSDLTIRTTDQAGAALPNVDFHLEGGRILGTDTQVPPETVYILDADRTTDAAGENKLDDLGPGQFFITGIEAPAGYALVEVDPITMFDGAVSRYGLALLPDGSETVVIRFAPDNQPGLIVKVKDNLNVPANEAAVRLTSLGGYEGEVETSFDGVAFFPDDADQLIDGEYTLEITAAGFQPYSGTVEVDGLIVQEVALTAL